MGIFSVFSIQNAVQVILARRFKAVALATQPQPPPVPVYLHELHGIPRDDALVNSFGSTQWRHVLVAKVMHWAELAAKHHDSLLLCSDNDISLLPGWLESLVQSFEDAGRPDLYFQREGGDDAFFDPFPYNSGFFLMRGSEFTAAFWRHVARRTAQEQPGFGDQTIVNAELVALQPDGAPGCTAHPLHLRHAHFPPKLVVGGPVPPSDANALVRARVHHATSSGGARGKLTALENFLEAWLAAANISRAAVGLPRSFDETEDVSPPHKSEVAQATSSHVGAATPPVPIPISQGGEAASTRGRAYKTSSQARRSVSFSHRLMLSRKGADEH
eukprot:CAMPEP_0119318854 /NCGR_PEP_ID=MMETSP1333-20130426/47813_1 /TAXON_ID=418940 /ORGANISM="Scyphosphaera apsteinii, Strain RCC1455" /LENGTH=329 /DNA_ID=CAMNT_0007325149 /DNA_START=232 /DNA_END=1221 /DNA_ORIENTATION=+